MIKLIIHIVLFSYLFSNLPNDVRWVRDSKEYQQICKNVFNSAYDRIKTIIDGEGIDILAYQLILNSIDKGNSMNISSLVCSKHQCIGGYLDNNKTFKVKIPPLSNSFIQKVKRANIDYKYVKNTTRHMSETSNYAIIVDIDETILDNSEYQVLLNKKEEVFNQRTWSDWVREEDAKLVPGARGFLKKIRDLGIQIIFISNRMEKNLLPTINNFKKLKIFSKKDIYLLRTDKEDRKPIRRKEVFSKSGRMKDYPQFRVISFLGDSYEDFPKNNNKYSWNLNYHIFPNPMYGKW